MKHWSQRNPEYANNKLGFCTNNTFETDGCLLMCFSMLSGKHPVSVNELFKEKGVYLSGCSINTLSAASVLQLRYDGKEYHYKPNFICIAETLDYDRPSTSFKEQHFFIFAPAGTVDAEKDLILDPLDYNIRWKENPYTIQSYRLFHEKKYTPLMPEIWSGTRPDDFAKRSEVDIMFYNYNNLI